MNVTLKTFFALGFSASMFLSSKSFAVEVPGKVFYKMPAGDLVSRAVKLDVPPRGEGKVIFKSEHHELESHAFKTKKAHGRTVFSVLFLNPPGAPANTAMVLTGSYMRGSNYVAYYGDVYSKTISEGMQQLQQEGQQSQRAGQKLLDEVLNLNFARNAEQGDDDWKFSGGFKFGKKISHQHHQQDEQEQQIED